MHPSRALLKPMTIGFPLTTMTVGNLDQDQVMQIEHWHSERDGPLSEEAMRRKLEDRGYSVSRYDYPPGTFFPGP
jgi:hypothetical protein